MNIYQWVVTLGILFMFAGAMYERYIGAPRRYKRVMEEHEAALQELDGQWPTTNSGPTSN